MLEDAYNDIIQKARAGLGLSIRTLSDKVGMSPSELVRVEAGRAPISFKLAERLGLSYDKLIQIYHHQYMPKQIGKKLGLSKFAVEVGGFESNGYVLQKLKNANLALLVDAVGVLEEAIHFIQQQHLCPVVLLITHGHFDHIGGMEKVKSRWPEIKVIEAGQDVKEDGLIKVSGFKIQALKTPGHSEDAVCYLVDDQVMFTGDTLFAGSVGRPNYDYQRLLQSSKEKIFTLADDVVLCPGHGPLTTVGQERRHNPFF